MPKTTQIHRKRGREMLRSRNAKLEWEVRGPADHTKEGTGTISGWSIGETFVILHEYGGHNGFEIFQPVNEENNLAALSDGLDKLTKQEPSN